VEARALRQVVQRYPLAGLQEDLPWSRDFAPNFALPPDVCRMAQHAFTELLNNAIDHSGGTQVTVSMRQTPLHLQLLVSDDGCGLFERIARPSPSPTPRWPCWSSARASSPASPSATPAAACSSPRAWPTCSTCTPTPPPSSTAAGTAQLVQEPSRSARQGTSVYLAIALDTARTLDSVLRAHSLDGDGYAFDRTVVPLQLLAAPGWRSIRARRPSAWRAAAALSPRRDSTSPASADIGHGFADELFRVAARRPTPGCRSCRWACRPASTRWSTASCAAA
jgi:hypothetical protein